MACNGNRCNACSGQSSGCPGCSGCGGQLELTRAELVILEQLGIYAFLPVARCKDTMTPHCIEDGLPEDSTAALQLLERKALIRMDYDKPLENFDYRAYADFAVHGSIALTQRGQQVLELLEIHGIASD